VSTTIFQASNKHTPAAGNPPQIDANVPGKYYGYFENEHGEQAIFIYDYTAQTGMVWLGDAGWEKAYKVVDGLAPELILSEEEETWLQACWNAATAFHKDSG
jgi:hypothetical protein